MQLKKLQKLQKKALNSSELNHEEKKASPDPHIRHTFSFLKFLVI